MIDLSPSDCQILAQLVYTAIEAFADTEQAMAQDMLLEHNDWLELQEDANETKGLMEAMLPKLLEGGEMNGG